MWYLTVGAYLRLKTISAKDKHDYKVIGFENPMVTSYTRSHEDDREETHSSHLVDEHAMMGDNKVKNSLDNSRFNNWTKSFITVNA